MIINGITDLENKNGAEQIRLYVVQRTKHLSRYFKNCR